MQWKCVVSIHQSAGGQFPVSAPQSDHHFMAAAHTCPGGDHWLILDTIYTSFLTSSFICLNSNDLNIVQTLKFKNLIEIHPFFILPLCCKLLGWWLNKVDATNRCEVWHKETLC